MLKEKIVPIRELQKNGFQKEHLKYHKDHCDANQITKLPLKYLKITDKSPIVINRNLIQSDYGNDEFNQKARRFGAVTKEEYNNLKRDIETGWDLTEPSVVFYQPDVKVDQYRYVTGHTRDRVCDDLKIDTIFGYNLIRKPGVSDSQVQDELSQLGILTQDLKHEYCKTKSLDPVAECLRAIANGWVSLVGLSYEQSVSVVYNRIKPQCDRIPLAENKIKELCYSIIQQSPSYEGSKVIPMTNKESIKWCKRNNYTPVYERGIDENLVRQSKVIYWPCAYNLAIQNFDKAIKFSADNDIEVRLVFHTSTLTSDPKGQYEKRTLLAYREIKDHITAMQQIYFNNTPAKGTRVKVYAMIPSVESEHNLKKLNIFDRVLNDGTFKVFDK